MLPSGTVGGLRKCVLIKQDLGFALMGSAQVISDWQITSKWQDMFKNKAATAQ